MMYMIISYDYNVIICCKDDNYAETLHFIDIPHNFFGALISRHPCPAPKHLDRTMKENGRAVGLEACLETIN